MSIRENGMTIGGIAFTVLIIFAVYKWVQGSLHPED
jgi:hypothetical protein